MKLRYAVKYRYTAVIKPLIVFCAVLTAVNIADIIHSFIIKSFSSAIGLYTMFFSAAFLMAIGFMAFKPSLKFLLQNGCSRQLAHYSFLGFLPITFVISAVNTVLYLMKIYAAKKISDASGRTPSIVSELLTGGSSTYALNSVVIDILIPLLFFLAALSLGYALAVLFSRINILTRLIVCVFLPAIIVLGLVLATVQASSLPLPVFYIMQFLFGSSGGYYFYANHLAAALIMLTLIFLSSAHLLIRKTSIKK